MTDTRQVMSDLVGRINAEIKRQREIRGTILDYGTPDPLLVEAAARITDLETALAEAEGTIAVLRERLANSMPIAGGNPFRSAGCSALASDPLLDRQGKEGR